MSRGMRIAILTFLTLIPSSLFADDAKPAAMDASRVPPMSPPDAGTARSGLRTLLGETYLRPALPADSIDGVVPERQVAGEEDPGDRGEPDGGARNRPEPTLLEQGDRGKNRQAEQAAEHCRGRRRDVRVPVQDSGERDAHRAGQGRQSRPPGDRLKWPRKAREIVACIRGRSGLGGQAGTPSRKLLLQ